MFSVALLFIIIFFILIMVPSLGIGWLGYKLITRLGRYPSKTPAIQMSVLVKLVFLEILSLTMILAVFKVLTAE